MILPFGLKQKPLNHYFRNGVVRFSCREGTLFYQIKQITKTMNFMPYQGEVKSEDHLDRLLSIKSLGEIHSIEVVQQ